MEFGEWRTYSASVMESTIRKSECAPIAGARAQAKRRWTGGVRVGALSLCGRAQGRGTRSCAASRAPVRRQYRLGAAVCIAQLSVQLRSVP